MPSKRWEQELKRRAHLSPEELEDFLRRRREYNTAYVRSKRANISPEQKRIRSQKQLEYLKAHRQRRTSL